MTTLDDQALRQFALRAITTAGIAQQKASPTFFPLESERVDPDASAALLADHARVSRPLALDLVKAVLRTRPDLLQVLPLTVTKEEEAAVALAREDLAPADIARRLVRDHGVSGTQALQLADRVHGFRPSVQANLREGKPGQHDPALLRAAVRALAATVSSPPASGDWEAARAKLIEQCPSLHDVAAAALLTAAVSLGKKAWNAALGTTTPRVADEPGDLASLATKIQRDAKIAGKPITLSDAQVRAANVLHQRGRRRVP